MSPTEQPLGANPNSSVPVYVAICSLCIIFALVLGVGLASNLVLRHIVQTVPFWVAVVSGFRRSRAASWAGLPLFLFWLVLMSLIWAYLLGISHLVNGHFSPTEIVMTIIVGCASAAGIVCSIWFKSNLSLAARLSSFVVMAVFQWICFRLSFLPAIANR